MILSEHQLGIDDRAIERHLAEIYVLGYYADVYAEVRDDSSGSHITYVAEYNPTLRGVKFKGALVLGDSLLMEKFHPLKMPLAYFLKQRDLLCAQIKFFFQNP